MDREQHAKAVDARLRVVVEEQLCRKCKGSGRIRRETCRRCGGTGRYTPPAPVPTKDEEACAGQPCADRERLEARKGTR